MDLDGITSPLLCSFIMIKKLITVKKELYCIYILSIYVYMNNNGICKWVIETSGETPCLISSDVSIRELPVSV